MKKSCNDNKLCISSHEEINELYRHPNKYNFEIVQLEFAYGEYFLTEITYKKEKR